MEGGDSVRHLNYDSSTDCHEHYFVHGYGLLFFEVFLGYSKIWSNFA